MVRKKRDVVSNDDVRNNPAMTRRHRHHVVTVVAEGMSALEPAVAHDFFGDDRSEYLGVDWYRYSVTGVDRLPQCRSYPRSISAFSGGPTPS